MNKNDFLVVKYSTNDIHAKQNRGGDNTVFDSANFDKHRTELIGYATNAVNYFEKAFNKYPNTSGVVKIYLREQAFAKSYRPTEIIKDADCKIVGTGNLGELFVSVNSSSISKLETKIKNSQKQKNIANISAIKEIAPYTLDDSLREDELLAILEIELEKHPEIKIWNLSLGTDVICDDYSFSDFGMALDELQDRFNVIFVIAAGNYCESPLRQWPSNILDNIDRITTPADSVRAITVGSLEHKQIISSIVSPNEPSPFSRRGPGPMFIPKPEVVHYGGNCDKELDCKQTGLVSFDEAKNLTESVGTSFSTPIVSTILANLVNNIDDEFNPNLAKALLIHSAVLKQKELSESDINYFGFGVPGDLNEMLLSPDWQAT